MWLDAVSVVPLFAEFLWWRSMGPGMSSSEPTSGCSPGPAVQPVADISDPEPYQLDSRAVDLPELLWDSRGMT